MNRREIAYSAIAALAIAGCGQSDPTVAADRVATRSSALVIDNGRSLNGRSLNGRSLNGRSLNGRSLNGVTLTGAGARQVTVDGVELASVTLSGTTFSGWFARRTGHPDVSGMDFVGSTWAGMLSDGDSVQLRIDAIEPLPAPNGDLLGYAVSFATEDGWVPYCGNEQDGSPALAIPMAGIWNYAEDVRGAGRYDDNPSKGFTFACRHAAIAKCVELGYRPWAKVKGKSLRPLTVACTRLLRADYCGTGVSYTLDGTLLDLDDELGIQSVAEPDWRIEAAWGENGAVCMAPGSGSRFVNTSLMPPCYAELSWMRDCGETFSGATLLVNRYAGRDRERFTGMWYGSADHGWGRVWLSLRQTGELVEGSYVTDKGASGTMQGTVVGRTVDLTIFSEGRKGCTGLLLGSALVDAHGSTLALDAASTSCKEPLTLELEKQ